MPRRRAWQLALLLCGVTLSATAGAADVPEPSLPQDFNPRYVLIDTYGRMTGNEDFPGRFQLLTFGYTSCPDVCPTTLANMVRIQRQLGDLGARLQLVFITLDPERDDQPALARYTAYFGSNIIGLTGPPDLVRAAAGHYQVKFDKYAEPGAPPGRYSVDHTTGMYLLGPDGMFVTRFAYDADVAAISARIRSAMQADGDR